MPDTNPQPNDFEEDDFSTEYYEPKTEFKEPSEHAIANWREAFQDFVKPTDGKWADAAVSGFADAFKNGAQMYALTYDPTGAASFAASMALDIIATTVGKTVEVIADHRKEDFESDHHHNATKRLTDAIISRDHTQIRSSLDYASELQQRAQPPKR